MSRRMLVSFMIMAMTVALVGGATFAGAFNDSASTAEQAMDFVKVDILGLDGISNTFAANISGKDTDTVTFTVKNDSDVETTMTISPVYSGIEAADLNIVYAVAVGVDPVAANADGTYTLAADADPVVTATITYNASANGKVGSLAFTAAITE